MSAKGQQPVLAIANQWSQGVGRNGPKWAAGCQTTQKDLYRNALAKVQNAMANYTRSVSPGGTWNNKMMAGQVGDWKAACNLSGSQTAYASSPQAKGGKATQRFARFVTAAQPVWQQMTAAAAAAQGTVGKFQAAIAVLQAKGSKTGDGTLKVR